MAGTVDKFIDRRAPLAEDEKQIMMAVLIRNAEAFETVLGQLSSRHFSPGDRCWSLLWACVVDYFDENGELPQAAYLSAEIQRRTSSEDNELLEEEEINRLDEFLTYAYSFAPEDLKPGYALRRVKHLMEDTLQSRVAEFVNDRDTPLDLGKLLGQVYEEAVGISSISSPSLKPFPDDDDEWAPRAINRYTTGVPFLDTYLEGGQSPGESYLLCAPYGTCKTMLGVQITVGTAIYLYRCWVMGGRKGPCPVTYYGSYEEPMETLRLRAISYAASIHRNSIWTKEAWATRSTRGKLKPYELEIFSPDDYGEVERMRMFKKILNECWMPFDLTGGDKLNPGRGCGGVDELAGLIRADHRQRGQPQIGTVVLDYVQMVADRYVGSAKGGDYRDLRHIVGRMPGHVAHRIGKPLSTPVWLMAQFNGTANGMKPGTLPNHTEAAEAKNLGENADFAFVIGAKNHDSLCQLGATKARRAALQREIVIEIDGAMNIVRDRSKDMCLDPASKRIVKRGDLGRVVADDTPDYGQAGDEVASLGSF